MNFIEAYNKGQTGSNIGLPMGDGLNSLSLDIRGVQRAMIYAVAAGAKAGKSTFVDYAFVISTTNYVIANNIKYFHLLNTGLTVEQIRDEHNIRHIDLEIIYNSYEIDRISKEFDFVAHFLNADFGIEYVTLDAGITFEGQNVVPLSTDYLRGRLVDDATKKLIKVKSEIYNAIGTVYTNKIVPLFGQYNSLGQLEKKGFIIFLEQKENPTGVRNYLIDYAKKHGEVLYTKFVGKDGKAHQKIAGYVPLDPDKFVIVITDHLRKLSTESGFTLKQTVDKFSEYAVELKNMFKFSFVHIIHLNRSMSDIGRMKQQDDMLYPNSDDVKETGNLAEDCDYMITLFNPNDDRYNLSKHFGKMIKDRDNNLLYPNMRSIHLVENRHGPYPQHYRVNMDGKTKKFEQIKD